MARILIVDDDFTVARALGELVTKLGHRAITCSDGLDAIALLDAHTFAAIFSDWQMGEISGIEVLEVAQMRNPFAKRILITASPTAEEVKDAVKDGIAQELVGKPWGLSDIRNALRGV